MAEKRHDKWDVRQTSIGTFVTRTEVASKTSGRWQVSGMKVSQLWLRVPGDAEKGSK